LPKLVLTDLANLNNQNTVVATINSNNTATETALEKTLSRDGTTPNQMEATLDMNSNRIVNLPAPLNSNDAARRVDVENAITTGFDSPEPSGSFHTDKAPFDVKLRRFDGRMFLGDIAKYSASVGQAATDPAVSPVSRVLHSWLFRDSDLSVSSAIGSMAVVGLSQASKKNNRGPWHAQPTVSPATIGITGSAVGDDTTASRNAAWGGYFEAFRLPGGNPIFGIEGSAVNIGNANIAITPANVKSGGMTNGAAIWLQSGGGLDAAGYSNQYGPVGNIGCYIAMGSSFVNNFPRAWSGIVFDYNSLVDISGGSAVYSAMQMPGRAQISWHRSDGTGCGYIWSNSESGTGTTGISLGNQTISFDATSGVTAASYGVDTNFTLTKNGGTTPRITFDTNDYIEYDRTNNNLSVVQNSVVQASINTFGVVDTRVGLSVAGSLVVAARKTGWAVDTGTAKRTTNATYSGTASASYTQAEITALMNAVRDLSQTIKALKDDLHAANGGHSLLAT
jgi:hypothetical protein